MQSKQSQHTAHAVLGRGELLKCLTKYHKMPKCKLGRVSDTEIFTVRGNGVTKVSTQTALHWQPMFQSQY